MSSLGPGRISIFCFPLGRDAAVGSGLPAAVKAVRSGRVAGLVGGRRSGMGGAASAASGGTAASSLGAHLRRPPWPLLQCAVARTAKKCACVIPPGPVSPQRHNTTASIARINRRGILILGMSAITTGTLLPLGVPTAMAKATHRGARKPVCRIGPTTLARLPPVTPFTLLMYITPVTTGKSSWLIMSKCMPLSRLTGSTVSTNVSWLLHRDVLTMNSSDPSALAPVRLSILIDSPSRPLVSFTTVIAAIGRRLSRGRRLHMESLVLLSSAFASMLAHPESGSVPTWVHPRGISGRDSSEHDALPRRFHHRHVLRASHVPSVLPSPRPRLGESPTPQSAAAAAAPLPAVPTQRRSLIIASVRG